MEYTHNAVTRITAVALISVFVLTQCSLGLAAPWENLRLRQASDDPASATGQQLRDEIIAAAGGAGDTDWLERVKEHLDFCKKMVNNATVVAALREADVEPVAIEAMLDVYMEDMHPDSTPAQVRSTMQNVLNGLSQLGDESRPLGRFIREVKTGIAAIPQNAEPPPLAEPAPSTPEPPSKAAPVEPRRADHSRDIIADGNAKRRAESLAERIGGSATAPQPVGVDSRVMSNLLRKSKSEGKTLWLVTNDGKVIEVNPQDIGTCYQDSFGHRLKGAIFYNELRYATFNVNNARRVALQLLGRPQDLPTQDEAGKQPQPSPPPPAPEPQPEPTIVITGTPEKIKAEVDNLEHNPNVDKGHFTFLSTLMKDREVASWVFQAQVKDNIAALLIRKPGEPEEKKVFACKKTSENNYYFYFGQLGTPAFYRAVNSAEIEVRTQEMLADKKRGTDWLDYRSADKRLGTFVELQKQISAGALPEKLKEDEARAVLWLLTRLFKPVPPAEKATTITYITYKGIKVSRTGLRQLLCKLCWEKPKIYGQLNKMAGSLSDEARIGWDVWSKNPYAGAPDEILVETLREAINMAGIYEHNIPGQYIALYARARQINKELPASQQVVNLADEQRRDIRHFLYVAMRCRSIASAERAALLADAQRQIPPLRDDEILEIVSVKPPRIKITRRGKTTRQYCKDEKGKWVLADEQGNPIVMPEWVRVAQSSLYAFEVCCTDSAGVQNMRQDGIDPQEVRRIPRATRTLLDQGSFDAEEIKGMLSADLEELDALRQKYTGWSWDSRLKNELRQFLTTAYDAVAQVSPEASAAAGRAEAETQAPAKSFATGIGGGTSVGRASANGVVEEPNVDDKRFRTRRGSVVISGGIKVSLKIGVELTAAPPYYYIDIDAANNNGSFKWMRRITIGKDGESKEKGNLKLEEFGTTLDEWLGKANAFNVSLQAEDVQALQDLVERLKEAIDTDRALARGIDASAAAGRAEAVAQDAGEAAAKRAREEIAQWDDEAMSPEEAFQKTILAMRRFREAETMEERAVWKDWLIGRKANLRRAAGYVMSLIYSLEADILDLRPNSIELGLELPDEVRRQIEDRERKLDGERAILQAAEDELRLIDITILQSELATVKEKFGKNKAYAIVIGSGKEIGQALADILAAGIFDGAIGVPNEDEIESAKTTLKATDDDFVLVVNLHKNVRQMECNLPDIMPAPIDLNKSIYDNLEQYLGDV